MKLERYIKKELKRGCRDFDIKLDEKLNVIKNGLHKIRFKIQSIGKKTKK